MPRFSEALNRAAETIQRPKPLPIGTYIARVTKQPDPPTSQPTKAGNMEKLTIPLAIVSAVEVDEELLAEFGNVERVPVRRDFLFMEDDPASFDRSVYQFKLFCGHCGIDTETGTMGEWMTQLAGAQMTVEITHRIDPQDDTNVFVTVNKTGPVE